LKSVSTISEKHNSKHAVLKVMVFSRARNLKSKSKRIQHFIH